MGSGTLTRRIVAEDSVRDVMAQYPATAGVFDRFGLAGCGGAIGPDERLDVFAVAHEVPLGKLLDALNEVKDIPAPPRVARKAAAMAQAPELLYRRFVLTALLATLTLGATYGAFNLAAVHLGVTWFPWFNHPLHATFQLFGFVLLFTLGVAFHAVPRFMGGPLGAPWAAKLSFPLLVAGLVARGFGVYLHEKAWAAWVVTLAGVLLVAGTSVAYWALIKTWERPAGVPKIARRPPFLVWLSAGTVWWIVAAVCATAVGVTALFAENGLYDAQPWNEPLYVAALIGGALSWVCGMLWRIGPAFLGIATPSEESSRRLWIALQAGIAATFLGAVLKGPLNVEPAVHLYIAGLVWVGVVVCVYAFKLGMFERIITPGVDRELLFAVQVAFGFAVVYALLAAVHAGLEWFGGGSNHLVLDAARHALAQGFVGLLILVVATRILPIFGGVELMWARAREWAVLAVAIGVLLRLTEVPAMWWPKLLAVSGTSGAVAGTGVAVLTISLLGTLLRRPRRATLRTPAALHGSTKVADLLDSYPPALGILIAHGFAPLANPVSRRTLARAVSLEQACRMHGKDAEKILAEIRDAVSAPRCGTSGGVTQQASDAVGG